MAPENLHSCPNPNSNRAAPHIILGSLIFFFWDVTPSPTGFFLSHVRHRPGKHFKAAPIISPLLNCYPLPRLLKTQKRKKTPPAPMPTASEPPIDNPAEPPSTLHRAKVNAAYLVYGSKAAVAPASLTTRSALTTTRYVLRYVVRRLLRYTKYALIGGCLAALGGGLLGTIGSGLAFFAAPSIGVGMGIGVITAILKVMFLTTWPNYIN